MNNKFKLDLEVTPRYIINLGSKGLWSPQLTAKIIDKGPDNEREDILFDSTNKNLPESLNRELKYPLGLIAEVMNYFNYNINHQDRGIVKLEQLMDTGSSFPGAYRTLDQFLVAYNQSVRNG